MEVLPAGSADVGRTLGSASVGACEMAPVAGLMRHSSTTPPRNGITETRIPALSQFTTITEDELLQTLRSEFFTPSKTCTSEDVALEYVASAGSSFTYV
jgi:hypothetical protein